MGLIAGADLVPVRPQRGPYTGRVREGRAGQRQDPLLSSHFQDARYFCCSFVSKSICIPMPGEFEARDFVSITGGNRIDLLLQLPVILHQVLALERLVREAHVQLTLEGMALCRRQVDETSLARECRPDCRSSA